MVTYILGDIHGEYQPMCDLLQKVGLIEINKKTNLPRWKKGCNDTLIQVGDMIDGCNGSIKSYLLLKRLQEEAKYTWQGKVIRLLGNHELAYISPFKCTGMDNTTDLVLRDIIKQEVIDGKIQATCFINGWIISHAGITESIFRENFDCWNRGMISEYYYVNLIDAIKNNNFSNFMFNIGNSRGGMSNIPGIFWADWNRDILANIKQIVGHTSMSEIIINDNHINVDCGFSRRSYQSYQILKYENNGFEIITL